MTYLNNRLWFKWSEKNCASSDIKNANFINRKNLLIKPFCEDTATLLHRIAFTVNHTAFHLWREVLVYLLIIIVITTK